MVAVLLALALIKLCCDETMGFLGLQNGCLGCISSALMLCLLLVPSLTTELCATHWLMIDHVGIHLAVRGLTNKQTKI